MKISKYLYLLMAWMVCITAIGQNTLTVPALTGGQGKVVSIPVEMDNTDEVVAVQFDIALPFPKASSGSVTLNMGRNVNGHTVSVRSLGGNNYTVVVVNMGNQPLAGNGGQLLTFPIQVPSGLDPETTYPITLSNVILTNRKGDNILTGANNGSYIVQRQPSPDLEVKDVAFGQNVLVPGEKATVTWTVTNVGDDDTHSGWVENVYLVNKVTEEAVRLGNNYVYDKLLKGGQTVRSMQFDIPKAIGMEDEVMAKVVLEPNSDTGEYNTDRMNNQSTGGTATMQKKLFIAAPADNLVEGASMRLSLTRSGDKTLEESFEVTTTLPDNVSVPQFVTFSAGQAVVNFDVTCIQNTEVNTYRSATVTVKSANGYNEDVEVSFGIEDDELLPLTASIDKTEYNEGDIIKLQVSVPYRIEDEELCLGFSVEKGERFVLPQSYRFEDGATSALIEIPILQDNKPANEEGIQLIVSAPHHKSASVMFILKDDDMPAISMNIQPTIVSEAAGYGAMQATIVRNGALNSKVTLKLSDDGKDALYYNNTVTLDEGVDRITFPISVKDNQVVDGTRKVKLNAAIYLTDCGCSAIGDKQTSVSEEITITDNDGPSLSLSLDKTTILEGDPQGAILKITRNTDVTNPLKVTLDVQGGTLKYANSVTIPAGLKSVTTVILSEKNAQTGDDFLATIVASCEGFSQGTAWLKVSDRTLPDAEMLAPECNSEVSMGAVLRATVKVRNIGAAVMPKGGFVKVELGDASTVIQIDEDIEIGDTYSASVDLKAPVVPGNYKLCARIEESAGAAELQTLNNIAYTDVKVLAYYSYSVAIGNDSQYYYIGDRVKLCGNVTNNDGSIASNVKVEPYLVYAGSRIPLEATTDAEGNFTAEYTIPAGMGGDFGYGVCTPGEKSYETTGDFGVYSICRTETDYIVNKLYLNEPYKGKIEIRNMCSQPLHNLRMVCDNPGAYDITFGTVGTLKGKATAEIEYTMQASEVSLTNDWDVLKFHVTCDEGVSLDIQTYNYTYSRQAKLEVETTSINTTLTKGTTRLYPVNITNNGLTETGKIKVLMPEGLSRFVSLASSSEIQSLAMGDSATVLLKFDAADYDVNIIQKGNIAINCENGQGKQVFFNVKVVSEEKGSLRVKVQDENTIYGNKDGERPYVKNANVRLTDYNTGALVMSGLTGEDGSITWENLNEGYYHLHVSADKHGSYDQNVLVSPGEMTEHTASINYMAVTVDWVVEETEIEDEYEIVSKMSFETHLPVPVVIMTGPDEINLDEVTPGKTGLMNMVLRNKGLISALNVKYTAPTAPGYVFVPLVESSGFELAPEQSYVIPVLIMCEEDYNDPGFAASVKRRVPARIMGRSFVCNIRSFVDYVSPCGPKGIYAAWEVGAHVISRVLCPDGNKVDNDKPSQEQNPDTSGKRGLGSPLLGGGEGSASGGPGGSDAWGAYMWTGILQFFCHASVATSDLASVWSVISKPSGEIPQKAGEWVAEQLASDGSRKALARAEETEPLPALLQSAYDKLYCFLNYYSTIHSYRVEMTGAPEALAIEGDFYANFVEALEKVETEMRSVKNKGELWNFNLESIPDISSVTDKSEGIGAYLTSLMPNGRANVADFSLRSYVERLRNKWRMDEGMGYDSDNHPDAARLDSILNVRSECVTTRRNLGCATWDDLANSARKDYITFQENQSKQTCATVKLEIKQQMVFTRQAFRGTLTIDNASETALTDINLNVNATNMTTGAVATSHEMQITIESIEGFGGEKDGKWSLPKGGKGVATILFIPTKYAAPDTLTTYSFGGMLSFNDGETVQNRSLYPVSLQVKPTPELDLTYFVQRDVYGDNPLTPDVNEPVIPAEFSVLIHNKGRGSVNNLRMLTSKPRIVDNEKGLLEEFDIVSSSLNGGEKAMALEDDIATFFGTIEAGGSSYATWDLTSSLMGHFTDYDVSYTHVTDYDNPDLSLLDRVTIHELIHSQYVNVGGKTYRAWITNDTPDAQDAPDHIYLSDGTDEEMAVLNDAASIVSLGQNRYRITVNLPQKEWFYTSLANPAGRGSNVVSVINEDSGSELDQSACWTTDYTIKDGFNPMRDYRLHLADYGEGIGERHYIVEFEPAPDVRLEVKSIATLPQGDEIAETPINSLTVTFNKDIDASSFTNDDIVVRYEGVVQETSLAVAPVGGDSKREFVIDTHVLDKNGFYVLQVNTDQIIDNEGFNGIDGKQVSWMLYQDGLIHYSADVVPSSSYGSVEVLPDDNTVEAPKAALGLRAESVTDGTLSGTTSYGEKLTLLAIPNEGYEFKYWKNNDDGHTISTDAQYSVEVYKAMELSAVFAPKQYSLNVLCDNFEGEASMTAGIYDHGTNIVLSATPYDGYRLVGYRVNGVMVETDGAYTLVVEENTQVEVVFEMIEKADSDAELETDLVLELVQGWNWISHNRDAAMTESEFKVDNVMRVLSQTEEIYRDKVLGFTGHLSDVTATDAVKVYVSDDVRIALDGLMFNAALSDITLHKGWNWLGYPLDKPMALVEALAYLDAEEGDCISNLTNGYAQFSNGEWIGDFETMKPGQGFLYKSVSGNSLRYNTEVSQIQSLNSRSIAHEVSPWNVDVHKYPHMMCVTAELYDGENKVDGNNYYLGAFVGDECRGVAKCIKGIYFLSVYGDANVKVRLMAVEKTTGYVHNICDEIVFTPDVLGTVSSPYRVNISAPTGIDGVGSDVLEYKSIYNIQGQKVNDMNSNGIYVIDGHKMIKNKRK